MPTCEPVQCDQEESTGELRSVISYGKRRRRRSTTGSSSRGEREDLLLVQSITITDKFGFQQSDKYQPVDWTSGRNSSNDLYDDASATDSGGGSSTTATSGLMGVCMNAGEAIFAGTVFLVAQIAIIAAWTFSWQRRRHALNKQQEALSVSVSVPGLHPSRSDSLCKLYSAHHQGYSRRF